MGSHEDLVEIGLAADQLLPNRLPRQAEATLIAASGGFCIMMADAMSAAGINLPHLAQATQDRIHAALPSAITNNPVDSSAQISSKPETLLEVLSALQEDPGDRVCVLFQSLSLYSSRLRGIYIEAMTRLRERYPQRVLVVISRGPEDAVQHIRQLGIPVFSSIDSAARGVAGLVRLSQLLEAPLSPAEVSTLSDKPLPATAFQNEFGAKRALASEGFAIPKEQQVHSADEAAQAAQAIGFPVVLKVVSQDLPHKTEAGGVALNLNDAKAVRTAYTRIMANVAQHAPNAKIEGILVAPMLIDGVELIAGISRDPVFGPVVMVGMGGIYAEVLRDVSVQVAPVSEKQALEMIRSLRLFSLLDGARGKAPLDQLAAARLVSQLSEFACRHSGQVAEIDLNPILVRAKGEGQALTDLLGGQIQMQITALNLAEPHIKSGRLRLLAVTGKTRLASLPQIPTVDESGLRGYESLGWIAVYGPAKIPAAISQRLAAEWRKVRATPEVAKIFEASGMAYIPAGTPEDLAAFQKAEVIRWERIIQKAGLKPE